MKNNAIRVGDLIQLNKKGERFMYGKALGNSYYSPIVEVSSRGIVVAVNDSGNAKIAWFAKEGLITYLSPRYLKRLNKR